METSLEYKEHTETANLSEIIIELDKIINQSLKQKNRNGYFAALYKNITQRVTKAIELNQFEDNERMRRFVVHFANYYIFAFQSYQNKSLEDTNPWYSVFELGKQKRTIVQHMLFGVNTHINYDLPNTCVAIAPGQSLLGLCNDFVHINTILSGSIQSIEKQIFTLSPVLALIGKLVSKFERRILNFSINVSRCKSWECACQQAVCNPSEIREVKAKSFLMTKEIERRILKPGFFASPLVFVVGMTEVRGMVQNMQVLLKYD